jgi:hypothetical protein
MILTVLSEFDLILAEGPLDNGLLVSWATYDIGKKSECRSSETCCAVEWVSTWARNDSTSALLQPRGLPSPRLLLLPWRQKTLCYGLV